MAFSDKIFYDTAKNYSFLTMVSKHRIKHDLTKTYSIPILNTKEKYNAKLSIKTNYYKTDSFKKYNLNTKKNILYSSARSIVMTLGLDLYEDQEINGLKFWFSKEQNNSAELLQGKYLQVSESMLLNKILSFMKTSSYSLFVGGNFFNILNTLCYTNKDPYVKITPITFITKNAKPFVKNIQSISLLALKIEYNNKILNVFHEYNLENNEGYLLNLNSWILLYAQDLPIIKKIKVNENNAMICSSYEAVLVCNNPKDNVLLVFI